MADQGSQMPGAEAFLRQMQTLANQQPRMAGMAPQLHRMVETQDKILSDFESLAQAVAKRQHEANREMLEITDAVAEAGNGDPSHAMRAMNDWMTQSMARVSADMKDGYDFWMRAVGHLAETGMTASEQAVESARSAGRGEASKKDTGGKSG
jgi:hypothetical protein